MANGTLKAIAKKHEVAEDQISAILSALSIKTENPSEIQVIGFEKVCELMKGGMPLEEAAQIVTTEAKAKTTVKDNPKVAQTLTVAERESQLKEIAVRYAIAHERIPEVLGAMKLKLETLTEAQIQLFQDVCQMLQSGMDLAMASQSAASNAKAQAKAKPDARNFPESAQAAVADKHPPDQSTSNLEAGVALAPRQDSPMHGLANQSIPDGHSETLQGVVDIAVDTAGFDVNGRIATKALDAAQALDGAIDEAIWRSLTDPSRSNALSAEKVVEAIHRKREERHGR
jgi:hypothetical protein